MRKVLLALALVLILQLVLVPASSAAPPPAGGFWHRVRYGETLSSIGRMYGVSAYGICRANNLRNCNRIYAGQRLWIPAGMHPPQPRPPHPMPPPHPRPPHPMPPGPHPMPYHR